jgi:hypothetical protein
VNEVVTPETVGTTEDGWMYPSMDPEIVVHSDQPSTNPLNAVVGAVDTGVLCSMDMVPFRIEVKVVGIEPSPGSGA